MKNSTYLTVMKTFIVSSTELRNYLEAFIELCQRNMSICCCNWQQSFMPKKTMFTH